MASISVLMPVYNSSKYLREAVDSVLCQTFTDFEFLIFNDGSTDDSLDIINSYNDTRIILINSIVNKGYLDHLNEGIKMAKGKYIARMDSDDICMPNRFELQYGFLEQNPAISLVGSNVEIIDQDGMAQFVTDLPIEHVDIQASLMFYCSLYHPTIMVYRDVLLQHPYDKDYYPSEDHREWVTLSEKYKITNIHLPLLKYRLHGQNISLVQTEKLLKAQMMLQDEYERRLKMNTKCIWTHRQLHLSDYKVYESGNQYFANNVLSYIHQMYTNNNREKIFDKIALKNILKNIWSKVYYHQFICRSQYLSPMLVFSVLNEDAQISSKINWFLRAMLNNAKIKFTSTFK